MCHSKSSRQPSANHAPARIHATLSSRLQISLAGGGARVIARVTAGGRLAQQLSVLRENLASLPGITEAGHLLHIQPIILHIPNPTL